MTSEKTLGKHTNLKIQICAYYSSFISKFTRQMYNNNISIETDKTANMIKKQTAQLKYNTPR